MPKWATPPSLKKGMVDDRNAYGAANARKIDRLSAEKS
jgi:hypothetical protein